MLSLPAATLVTHKAQFFSQLLGLPPSHFSAKKQENH